MAIGDNNNDIEMLRTVGWGVAMGQASEAVKSAARAVTASNREDGVAHSNPTLCITQCNYSRLKLSQTPDLPVIRRCLPTFLLHQLQSILRVHSIVN